MKSTVVCFVLFGLLAGVLALPRLPDYPSCTEDPIKGNPLCDIIPPGCKVPACGSDYNYRKSMWFGNECYMNQYNKYCGTNFRLSVGCNPLERPPPVLEPCPWPFPPRRF